MTDYLAVLKAIRANMSTETIDQLNNLVVETKAQVLLAQPLNNLRSLRPINTMFQRSMCMSRLCHEHDVCPSVCSAVRLPACL